MRTLEDAGNDARRSCTSNGMQGPGPEEYALANSKARDPGTQWAMPRFGGARNSHWPTSQILWPSRSIRIVMSPCQSSASGPQRFRPLERAPVYVASSSFGSNCMLIAAISFLK